MFEIFEFCLLHLPSAATSDDGAGAPRAQVAPDFATFSGEFRQDLLDDSEDVEEDVVVDLDEDVHVLAEVGHPAETHDAFVGQVVVGVDERTLREVKLVNERNYLGV